ncbi:MAG: glycosyltransferase family 4 protein [Bacteroidetes bacterium]|nr:glycosyltransferase family 4 protein [Bacteroidota bacterium]
MTYKQAILKFRIEYFFIFPIVMLGKIYGKLKRAPKKYTHFLFFPSADIGGSIKVNAEIADCIKEVCPLIIFSKIPKNNKFLHLFTSINGADCIDLSKQIDHKLYHFINIFYRGVLASWINAAEKPVMFGGESLYFYKVVPHVSSKVKVVELCHLNTWFNYSQAFVSRIDARIFSTLKIKRDAESLYRSNHLPEDYFNRLFFVDNKIDIPPLQQVNNTVLQVLFVGRGAPQKRVPLIIAIAEKLNQKKLPVHFSFVGDVEQHFTETNKQFCTLYGQVTDRTVLENIYQQSDVLILTSAYEGLPLVVMDMMARGKIILSTAVDAIPDYIAHEQTGLLITAITEEGIIEEGFQLVEWLTLHPEQKKQICLNTYHYAQQHFSENIFNQFYRNILACND